MIDYASAFIDTISVHHIGNKNNDEPLILSDEQLTIQDVKLKELLMKFFISSFTSEEYYSFTFSNNDFTLNPLYHFAEQIFSGLDTFHSDSIDIAKQLYEVSNHPQIKEGDLFVVHFTDLVLVDEIVNGIGIFKSENRHSFLKLDLNGNNFLLNYEDGINIEKLDKGCIIFNTDKEVGYKIAIVDKSSKSSEAQFWKDGFLQIKPSDDDYHKTKNFMAMAKTFVSKQIPEDLSVSRTDKMEMMNRSIDYFTSRESFDIAEFEDDVLQDKKLIGSFREFEGSYREKRNMGEYNSFDISPLAAKKQAKMYRSVLKLDGNFHIYIHGDMGMIEQGEDKNGRKYYKLYYEKES
ncbi:MAG: nucleoid-associated protein [Ignavibacteriales bacterium]|nr:nucleoid-associated protein [Ignavibacteriales bacterium]